MVFLYFNRIKLSLCETFLRMIKVKKSSCKNVKIISISHRTNKTISLWFKLTNEQIKNLSSIISKKLFHTFYILFSRLVVA